MKHKVFLFAVLLMALAIPQSVKAYSFSAVAPSGQTLYYQTYSYSLDVDVTYPGTSDAPWLNYEKPTGALIIPDSVTYNGTIYTVTTITGHCFEGCTGLTSVVVPNTVTTIYHNAFAHCTGLINIVLPNSLTRLGWTTVNATYGEIFKGCTSLTNIVLPDSLTTIGPNIFENCTSLTSITLPSTLKTLGSNAFAGCSSLSSILLPESLTSFGSTTFSGCTSLSTVYFNAAHLSSGSFSDLISLTTVIFGQNVTSLPSNLFLNCTGLTNITLPNSLRSIGTSAFQGCTSLTSIIIPEGVTGLYGSAFEGCTGLTTITLPESLTSISAAAFRQCTSLTSLTLGWNITRIYANAFSGCTSLSLVISNSVETINNYAFLNVPTVYYCGSASGSPWGALAIIPCYTEDSLIYRDSTKTVLTGSDANIRVANIPSSVVKIDYKAFSGRNKLISATIPSSVHSIGPQAFKSCSNLLSVTIPNAVTTINNETFRYCTHLQTVNLPLQMKVIGSEAFRNCTQLTSINLPSALESIGSNAFNTCSQLTTITIPESVKQIGSNVFNGSGLQTVFFNAKEVYASSSIFSGCNSLQAITLGDSVKRIPASMFRGLSQLNSLTHMVLPPAIRYIGDEAFYGCSQMVDITIPESVDTLGQKIFEGCLALKKVYYNAPHAVSTGSTYNPILAFRAYTCGTLSYCNTSGSPHTTILADHLPAYDTIVIGQNVETIPDYAFGLVFDANHDGSRSNILDSMSYIANTKVINNSTKLRYIGSGAFGNMRIHDFDFGDSIEIIGICAFMGNPIKKVFLPEGMEIIADGAFNNCHSLDSVSLPSTIQVLGADCFASTPALHYLYYDCEDAITWSYTSASYSNSPFCTTPNLQQIAFGPHVRYLNEGLLSNANGLQRLVLPEGVEGIDYDLFKMRYTSAGTPASGGYYPAKVAGSNLSYIDLPSSLIYIGEDAFSQVAVDTVVCRGITPAYIGNTFSSDTKNYGVLKVPCGAISTYNSCTEWMDFINVTEILPYNLQLTVNVDTMGSAAWVCATNGVSLTATPAPSHRFLQWGDGVTTNPRTIVLTSDTVIQAVFAWGELFNVNVSSTNNSRGNVTGSGIFVQNTVDTLTATPNYGYHFSHWNDGDTNNPRYLTVTSNMNLTATFQPNQYTLQVNSDDLLKGSVSGGGIYDYYTVHSFTAVPTTGYHFVEWNDGNTSNPRSIRITQDTTFTATFAINIYTLNVSSANANMGSATSDTTYYEHGDTALLNATANYGYHFSAWSDGNTSNPRLLAITQNTTLSAHFAVNQYMLTALADTTLGSVTGGGEYDYLSSNTLVATPIYGYHFSHWNDGDTTNPRVITLVQDTMFTAYFERNSYIISVQPSDAARGTVSGNDTALYLDSITISATANYGYHFDIWSDGDNNNPRTIILTQDIVLTAFFANNQYSLTVLSNDNTLGHVTGGGCFEYLDAVTVTAIEDDHCHFVRWDDGNTDNPRVHIMLGDTTLTAIFAVDTHHVSVAANDIACGGVEGGGDFEYGQACTVSATAYSGYRFTQWSNGSTYNPYSFAVLEDMELIAIFEEVEGVDNVELPNLIIYSNRSQIVVEGAEGRDVRVYDMLGRKVNEEMKSEKGEVILAVPTAGIYMVRIGDLPARRVVVVK